MTQRIRASVPAGALLLAACAWMPAFAIELSLEENRGDKGTIGFVDMERLFREFPETRRAKAEFEAEVDHKRLEVRRRQAEVLDLKSELARLAVERERLLKEALIEPGAPPAVSTAPLAPGATAAAPAPIESLPGLQAPTTAPLSAAATGEAGAPAGGVPVPAALPSPSVPLPTGEGGQADDDGAPAGGVPASGSAAKSPELGRAEAGAPAGGVPVPAALPSPSVPLPKGEGGQADDDGTPAPLPAAQRAQELEAVIAQKQGELLAREAALAQFQAKTQAELLDLEQRRVQILLGKIYDVVQDVAKEEGVSVVVDKKAILFGQKAVDLTEKLLERIQ